MCARTMSWEVGDEVGCIVKNLWLNLQEAVITVFVRKVKKLRVNIIPK